MVRYFIHEKESMETCKSYQTIYDTINKASDETKAKIDASGEARKSAFQNFVLYLLLSPYTQAKID